MKGLSISERFVLELVRDGGDDAIITIGSMHTLTTSFCALITRGLIVDCAPKVWPE